MPKIPSAPLDIFTPDFQRQARGRIALDRLREWQQRTDPTPHPLDVAHVNDLPCLLNGFWQEYHEFDGITLSAVDKAAAKRAQRRLDLHNQKLRDHAEDEAFMALVVVVFAVVSVAVVLYALLGWIG